VIVWLVLIGFLAVLAVWLGAPPRIGQVVLGVVCLFLLLAIFGVFGRTLA
jgi:hypothetical protein